MLCAGLESYRSRVAEKRVDLVLQVLYLQSLEVLAHDMMVDAFEQTQLVLHLFVRRDHSATSHNLRWPAKRTRDVQ